MGSNSDLPIMEKAMAVLEELGVEYEATVVSAHRTPERLADYATSAVAVSYTHLTLPTICSV